MDFDYEETLTSNEDDEMYQDEEVPRVSSNKKTQTPKKVSPKEKVRQPPKVKPASAAKPKGGRPSSKPKYEFNERDKSAIQVGISKYGNSWATIGFDLFSCIFVSSS